MANSHSIPVPVYRPRPPFLGWPAQHRFLGGHAWLSPYGPALVTQTSAERATVEMVNGFSDLLEAFGAAGVPEAYPGLVVIHDWRSLRSIDRRCREVYRERFAQRGAVFGSCHVYIAIGCHPLIGMVIRSTALALQVTAGQSMIRFIDDPSELLERHRIVAPSLGNEPAEPVTTTQLKPPMFGKTAR